MGMLNLRKSPDRRLSDDDDIAATTTTTTATMINVAGLRAIAAPKAEPAATKRLRARSARLTANAAIDQV
jgi:hypothetical protein